MIRCLPSKLNFGTHHALLYQQTAEWMLSNIHAGMWPRGERIPAELELAQFLGVSHITVKQAARRLVEQGVLEIRHGIGTFVRESAEQPPDAPDAPRRALPNEGTCRQIAENAIRATRLAHYGAASEAALIEQARLYKILELIHLQVNDLGIPGPDRFVVALAIFECIDKQRFEYCQSKD